MRSPLPGSARRAPPGTVLLVSPTGKVPPGGVVVLTTAIRPSPARAGPGGHVPPGRAKYSGRAKHGKGAPPGHQSVAS